MAGLPRSIIKKYGVSKKAWAVYRGSKTTTKRARRSRAGGSMVRRRKAGRKRGGFGGGIMGYIKPVLIGTAGGLITPRVPMLKDIPFAQAVGGGAACFLLGQKTLPKLAIGAASGHFIAPVANDTIASATGIRIY